MNKFNFNWIMSNPKERIVILTEDELSKTLSRLTFEIIEDSNLDNLLLVGIPFRGVIFEVLKKKCLKN